jgi:hypothetical protein
LARHSPDSFRNCGFEVAVIPKMRSFAPAGQGNVAPGKQFSVRSEKIG